MPIRSLVEFNVMPGHEQAFETLHKGFPMLTKAIANPGFLAAGCHDTLRQFGALVIERPVGRSIELVRRVPD
ncbi:MAG: hypothetical protein H6994_04720 [Pseudomonadales bacterium]|nr:hypothetical protein [Pseudomonadales bacterium]